MKFNRIYAIILRNLYAYKKSADRLVDSFYWPSLDLVIWGLTSSFFTQNGGNSLNLVTVIVSGLILWYFLWRAQYEVSINVVEEMWNKNLVNLFASPLKFSEWIVSMLILGLIKIVLSVGFAMILAYFLYKVQVFTLGFYLIPFVVLLILIGWAVGFIVSGLILRYGTKVQTLVWTAIWAISPFSAIYYPISALPQWAQTVASFVPTSYVFEGMREVLNSGRLDFNDLVLPILLTIIYMIIGIGFLKNSFNKLMDKGLVKAV